MGIKAASIYHHFPSKADLGAAVARRYWEDTAADLESMLAETSDPVHCLRQYPDVFRKSLESDNRMCLCSFMAAEYDDLPEAVKKEVQTFADVNVAWLSRVLSAAGVVSFEDSELTASFDGRTVIYGFGELDTLVPAYAATIHKSQGSEYLAVVIPVMTQHYTMLQRNLLYTGVTRGKKLVVLVGQKKAVAIAVRNVSGRRRWSKLNEWLAFRSPSTPIR